MMWPEMTDRERYYDACEAIEREREELHRDWMRRNKVCPDCGVREGLHDADCPRLNEESDDV